MSRSRFLYAVAALLVAAVFGLVGRGLAPAAHAADQTRVVLVGIGGLRWSDVNPRDTPTLYRLAGHAAVGMLSVRAVGERTCPLDGWLTLSAGERAAGGTDCTTLPEPYAGRLEKWDTLVQAQQAMGYGSQLGRLGDRLKTTNVCATAIGPGAAVALADSRGLVDRQARLVTPQVVSACPLTVIDAGDVRTQPVQRAADLQAADRTLAEAVAATEGTNATILVAGVSDESDAQTARLRLGLATGPGFPAGWLGSGSTRQDGLAQLTDLTPTLTELAGAGTSAGFVGSRWRSVGDRPAGLTDTIARLESFDTTERVVRPQSIWLFAGLAAIQLLGYGLALLAAVRGWRRPFRRAAVLAALVAGTVPVSTFLADLVPWNVSSHPSAVLWASLLGFVALLAFSVFLVARAPAAPPWIAPTALAGITSIVLAVDVIAGSGGQTGNLMTPGDLPVVGGRFFGFGNVAFSIFLTSALLLAAGVAAYLRRAGRRAWPAALAIGAVAVLIDGWPGWGADFGGILAAVPAVIVLTAGVAGVRLTANRILLTAFATVAAVAVLATLDWLRPPASRSHLGGFVQLLLDGEAAPVIARKAEMSLGTITAGGPLAWLAIAILVLAAAVVVNPERFRATALAGAYKTWPTLEPALRSLLVLGVVGFAVNDSGLVVPATVFATGLPLVVLAIARSQGGPTAERSSPQPRSAPAG